MSKKIKYLWHINNNEMAQFWAEGGVQHYLSAPTKGMPKEFIDSNNNIVTPTPLPYDLLGEHFIINAGYTVHPTGYYHSRQKKDYHVLLFVLDGKISLKSDSINKSLLSGNVLLVPAGCTCDESVKTGKATVFWLHIKNTNVWNFGKKTSILTPNFFTSITNMLYMYLEEVYSPMRSINMLKNIIEIVIEILKRNFGKKQERLTHHSLDAYISKIKKNPEKNWNRVEVAKYFNCPPNCFDKICTQSFGMTFSKLVQNIRMKTTTKLLENGEKNYAKIAKKVGYSNVSSLSKAFKATTGKSLRNFFK